MAERMRQFTDPELERALRSLGADLAYPPTPDVAAAVRGRIVARPVRPRPWWIPSPAARRRLAVALALLLVGAVILGALPLVRKGVARRLGLNNVAIVNVTAIPSPTPAPLPTMTAIPAPTPPGAATPGARPATPTPPLNGLLDRATFGTQTTLTEAQSRAPFAIRTPDLPTYRVPDEVYTRIPPPGGRVSLLYTIRADLPAIAGTDIGLLVQEFRGGIQSGLFQKGVPSGSRVEPVLIDGVQGYWIEGGLRTFGYTDANGVVQFEETRGAGNTLLWERDGVVYRLESSLPQADAVRIAASLR